MKFQILKTGLLFLALNLILVFNTNAQVGIGTTTPKSSLQVEGNPSDTTTPDGVQVPTLTITQLEGKIIGGAYGADQDGAIVYISDASIGSSIPETADIKNKGFYYYFHNGVSGTWRVMGEQKIDLTNPNIVPRWDGTNLIEGSIIDSGGNIGIGTTSPDALLDVEGTFQFKNGTEGKSKLLISDENGNANWAPLQAENIFGEGNVPDPDFSCLTVSGSLGIGDSPRSVAVAGDYAYVVDQGSNDLKVIDISNPASPGLSGSLGIGPGPTSIAVAGNYAYVVDTGSDDLKVIDISNPASPVLSGSLGIGDSPRSVAVAGDYAYVVDAGSDDLKVIDISNPASPGLSGSLGIDDSPRSVAVAGDYAYVVDAGSDDLKVIDISNPASPVLSGSLGIGTLPNSIAIASDYAYVVDFGTDDLKAIDISNPASPSLSGSLGLDITPVSVAVAGNYAYVVDHGSEDLKVIDISNPASPSLSGSLGLGSLPFSVAVAGNYAYVVDTGSDDFKVINLSCSINTTFNLLSNQFESYALISAVWTENGNSINNLNSGNVGIGTSSPQEKLHVEGTIIVDQKLQADDSGGLELATDEGTTRMRIVDNGNVGIGTTNPTSKLHVAGSISGSTLDTGQGANELYGMNQNVRTDDVVNFLGVNINFDLRVNKILANDNDGLRLATDDGSTRLRVFDDGHVQISEGMEIRGFRGISPTSAGTVMYEQLRINHPINANYFWSIGHQFDGPSSTDDDLYFYVNKAGEQNVAGVILDQNEGTIMNFTGQHRSLVDGIDYSDKEEIKSLEGLIVVADKNQYLNMSGGLSEGQEAITINEALPVVSLSTKLKDKSVFGVISTLESEDRQDSAGAFATPYDKEKGDERFYINSVGEGGVWIVDMGQSLESGDYIQTSNVKGYGMRQDDDLLHNYTVAKITMDCDFEPELRMKKQIKRMANEDGSYENVLDQFGRVEWEPMLDQRGQVIMELPYKMRYLNEDGETITKEDYDQLIQDGKKAYRAAFVGCTYHCG